MIPIIRTMIVIRTK